MPKNFSFREFKTCSSCFDSKKFEKNLEDLIKASYKNNDDIKEKLAKVVTTYKIDKNN